jgi:hypothetical protein
MKRKQVLNLCSFYLDKFLILGLAFGFVVQQLTGLIWLRSVLSLLVLIIILVIVPKIRGTVQVLSICFLVIGMALMLYQKVPFSGWQQAATLNVTLVTLFVFAPMFGIPVRLPVYVSALKKFYRTSIKGSMPFFVITQFLMTILAVFLNVGSVSVVYHLASIHRSSRSWRVLNNALNRGFSSAILWSPYFAAMAVVTNSLHVNWTELLPYLIGFYAISVFVSILIDFPYLRYNDMREEAAAVEEDEEIHERDKENSFKKLLPLVGYLLFAMAFILALEKFVAMSMVLIISLTAIFYPMLWCLISRSFSFYKQGVKDHVTKSIPALKKEIVLFLTAGFFSGAVSQTDLGEWIPSLFSILPIPLPIAFTICTLLLIVFTSMIGSHPIILITILATTVDPASVGVTSLFLGILLLVGWSISNLISPATAVNSLLSSLLKREVFDLIKVNYVYSAVLIIILPIYLFLIDV